MRKLDGSYFFWQETEVLQPHFRAVLASNAKGTNLIKFFLDTLHTQGWIQGSLPDFRNSLKFFPT